MIAMQEFLKLNQIKNSNLINKSLVICVSIIENNIFSNISNCFGYYMNYATARPQKNGFSIIYGSEIEISMKRFLGKLVHKFFCDCSKKKVPLDISIQFSVSTRRIRNLKLRNRASEC